MPSTCSIDLLYWSHAERLACSLSLRPASRDQIRGCAVRQHPPERQSDKGKPSNNHRSLRHQVSPVRINLLFTM
jgi:hypothetical protein